MRTCAQCITPVAVCAYGGSALCRRCAYVALANIEPIGELEPAGDRVLDALVLEAARERLWTSMTDEEREGLRSPEELRT